MEETRRFMSWLMMVFVVMVSLFPMSMKHVQCFTIINREGLVRYPLKALSNWNGKGVIDLCSWFGVECSHGNVVASNIGQLGNIAYRRQLLQPENAAISHKTKKDDIDSKNTLPPSSPPFPSFSPVSEPFSPSQLLVSPSQSPSNSPSPLISPQLSPSPSPSPSTIFFPISHSSSQSPTPSNPPAVVSTAAHSSWIWIPSMSSSSNQRNSISNKKKHSVIIWSTVGGFSFLVLVSAIVLICFRSSKVVAVKPWATGLSGQLRKAFVTGVPSLKRTELEVACEDFSNIIGSLPDETIYKGTLSSGVEIAVVSSVVNLSKNWSKIMQTQFRKKIEMLSRVNHKNFVNLIGYCEENKPFTRMMVFEYAPNGTLFEHLHIKEAEQLDWIMRMRIAMGIAYCLEHMHQLTPPIAHKNLLSSSIYLTEDYAAKISDLSFGSDIKKESESTKLLETTAAAHIKGNVYSFGVILFEMITGKIPYAVENGLNDDWAGEYLRGQPLRDLVDTSLNSLKEDEIEKWSEVINKCVHPDPEKRPSMKEVTSMLKEITAMGPDGAVPKASPLWWAEIEIMSTDLSENISP